ncbi:hypothetical protein KHA93_01165 [Bacillus sp. FJAT-49732]|uniref:Uncharacterized protein n=1 Tax=Lederbergia citrisecunda TaxID=2833583 RepID=A0A942TLS9_9BACI|nr:hypothetical protein [Lederbergia citrisecunda]MBS4198269.1 hypothetical protein [Lederbergia citrisecunda]
MMTAFWGLMKKDMLLMRFWYITWLIFSLICIVGGYFMQDYWNEPSIVVPIYIGLMSMHLFLMPIMILHVLNVEGKTQLWLYNPQSSKKLLLAKLSSAALLQFISQLLLVVYGLILMQFLLKKGLITTYSDFLPFEQGAFFHIALFSTSLYMTNWIIFLWTIYHSLGKIPALKNFRWLVVLLIWIAFGFVEAQLVKLKVLQNNLFSFSANVNVAPSMEYAKGNGWTIVYTDVPVPIVPIIMYIIFAIALFLIASRLLDKKVEV